MQAILLERLKADHHRYTALLCILDRQLHIAACEETPDHTLLSELIHYLTQQPEAWHHRVEDRLFAHLVEYAPESHELLAVMTEEHRRIATYGRELEAALQRAAATPEAPLELNLLNLARAFSELYHHHLHTEDHRVLPLLESHCTATEIDALALPLASPAEGGDDFQRLYLRLIDQRAGLRLGHGERADFCPVCDARSTDT